MCNFKWVKWIPTWVLADSSDVGEGLQLIVWASRSKCNPRGFPPITPVQGTAGEGADDVSRYPGNRRRDMAGNVVLSLTPSVVHTDR